MRTRPPLVAGLVLAWCFSAGAEEAMDPKFQPLCGYSQDLCDHCETLKQDIVQFIPPAKTADAAQSDDPPKPPTPNEIAGFNDRYRGVKREADKAAFTVDKATHSAEEVPPFDEALRLLRTLINKISFGVVNMDLKALSAALGDLEKDLSTLEKDVQGAGQPVPEAARTAFRRRLSGINEAGLNIENKLNRDSLIADRTNSFNGDRISEKGVNPLQDRLVSVRRRLMAVGEKLGVSLGEPPPADPAAAQKGKDGMAHAGSTTDPFSTLAGAASGGAAAGGGGGGSAGAPAFSLTGPKNLTDLKIMPPPPPFDAKKPQPPLDGGTPLVVTHKDGTVETWPDETADLKAMEEVKKLRAEGKTETHGDVAARAQYVFKQTGGTCAIASQVELEVAAGLIPNDLESKKAEETRLYNLAIDKGFFTANTGINRTWNRDFGGGTPPAYEGNLAGIPMDKHFNASDDALFKSVNSGKMVMVGVSAGTLWNAPDKAHGGHAILVTGVEVDKTTGKPLGYYINDTGYNQGGRFVPVEQFLDAWHDRGSHFAEPAQ